MEDKQASDQHPTKKEISSRLNRTKRISLRKDRDSNPGSSVTRLPHFECGPFDHSGIFPIGLVDAKAKKSTAFSRFCAAKLNIFSVSRTKNRSFLKIPLFCVK